MPALYNYYDPNGAVGAAQAKRDEAMGRLMDLAKARQRFTDQMYGEQQAQQAQMEAAANKRSANLNRSAMDEAAQGAALGAMGGPWGALIGGGIGSIIGGIKGYGQRRKEGQSGVGAFFRSAGDALTGGLGSAVSQAAHGDYDSITAGIPMLAGGAAMAGKGISDHFASQQQTAMDDQARAAKMAEYAQAGNALAEQERFNRKYNGQNYLSADNPMSVRNQLYGGGELDALERKFRTT